MGVCPSMLGVLELYFNRFPFMTLSVLTRFGHSEEKKASNRRYGHGHRTTKTTTMTTTTTTTKTQDKVIKKSLKRCCRDFSHSHCWGWAVNQNGLIDFTSCPLQHTAQHSTAHQHTCSHTNCVLHRSDILVSRLIDFLCYCFLPLSRPFITLPPPPLSRSLPAGPSLFHLYLGRYCQYIKIVFWK